MVMITHISVVFWGGRFFQQKPLPDLDPLVEFPKVVQFHFDQFTVKICTLHTLRSYISKMKTCGAADWKHNLSRLYFILLHISALLCSSQTTSKHAILFWYVTYAIIMNSEKKTIHDNAHVHKPTEIEKRSIAKSHDECAFIQLTRIMKRAASERKKELFFHGYTFFFHSILLLYILCVCVRVLGI